MTALVDANVLIRHLTGDPPEQAGPRNQIPRTSRGAAATGPDSGRGGLRAGVLLRGRARDQVAEALRAVLSFRATRVLDAALLHRTVELYDVHRLDFADAYLIATTERTGIGVVASFDHDLDRVGTIRRQEPS